MGFLSKLGQIGGDILGGVGSAFGINELISKPNAAEAYGQSQQAAATAYANSRTAATKSFERTRDMASYDRKTSRGQEDRAWMRQKKVLQNSVKWRMQDMAEAGLNPILAMSQGGMNTPSGSVNMGRTPTRGAPATAQAFQAQGFQPNMPRDFVSERGANIGRKTRDMASAQESTANVYVLRVQKGVAKAQERKLIEEGNNLQRVYMKIGTEIGEIIQRIELLKAKQDYTQEDTERVQQDTELIRIKTEEVEKTVERMVVLLKRLKTLDAMYDRPVGRWIREINETLRGILARQLKW